MVLRSELIRLPPCRRMKTLIERRRRRRRRQGKGAAGFIAILLKWLPYAHHYFTHVHKVPQFIGEFTGARWVDEILTHRSHTRSVNAFRMEKGAFIRLCGMLQHQYGLRGSIQMSVMEKVAIFVNTMAWGSSQRNSCERFQRSSSTISESITSVLDAI